MSGNNKLIAVSEVNINASGESIWKALVTPELIKQYLFGTNAVSEWKEGSEILFKGEWEGKEYVDKGIILKMVPGELFQHTYLPGGNDDIPENYSTVTYEISSAGTGNKLIVKQDNVKSPEDKKRFEANWDGVLKLLKEMLETKGG